MPNHIKQKNYCPYLKSGVNFKVVLQPNHARRN